MKKISVIVPIYNTKNELPRCLSSICNQTYRNLEIICVDDGSADGSEKILDDFAARDSRIVAIHQPNGGESNARNTGLRRATGEYIAFCDCDDWLDLDMYEILENAMEEDQLDLAAGSWYREFSGPQARTVAVTNELPVTEGIIDNALLLKYVYMRDSYRAFAYIWDKLYKREILCDETGELILFDESIRLGGDVIYLAEAALNTKRAKYIDRAFYHYNQREASGSHTRDVTKLRDWLRAYEYVIKRFQQENVSEETIGYVKRFMAYHSSNAAQIAHAQGDGEALKTFQQFMRRHEREYIALNARCPDRIARFREILDYAI